MVGSVLFEVHVEQDAQHVIIVWPTSNGEAKWDWNAAWNAHETVGDAVIIGQEMGDGSGSGVAFFEWLTFHESIPYNLLD